MAATSNPPAAPGQTVPDSLVSPGVAAMLASALKTGAFAGSAGVLGGVAAGIIRDASPAMFATVAGVQCFILGSSYRLSKTVVTDTWGGEENITKRDKTKASAIAGGTAGIAGGLVRGPRAMAYGAIAFTIIGAGGQALVNSVPAWKHDWNQRESLLRHKYSPLKKLTDDEYVELVENKILRVETEIALIDDKIASLKADQKMQQAAVANTPTSTPTR